VGQKVILLRFIEMMDLVNEEHGGFAETASLFGFLNNSLKIFNARRDRGKIHTRCARSLRQDLRQRCFTAARRTPKNERLEFARADHSAQKFPGAQQMVLPDELRECFWPHPFGERLRNLPVRRRLGFEKIHDFMLPRRSRLNTGAPLNLIHSLREAVMC
jgi:hypothetical protein